MAVLTINGLEVPDDFPFAEYEAVCSKTNDYRNHAAHPMLIGALFGVAHRFNALAEYDGKLRASIKVHGPGPGHSHHRYEQERDLFGFFSNGFSSLECFAFAMFAVGAIKGLPQFALATPEDEQQVNWRTLRTAYATAFPGDPVGSWPRALDGTADEPDVRTRPGVFACHRSPVLITRA